MNTPPGENAAAVWNCNDPSTICQVNHNRLWSPPAKLQPVVGQAFRGPRKRARPKHEGHQEHEEALVLFRLVNFVFFVFTFLAG